MPRAKGKRAAKTTEDDVTDDKSADTDFLSECERLFGSRDLYVVVGFEKDVDRSGLTKADVKKRYYKSSLLYHPDKTAGSSANANEDDGESTRKFQLLSKAHSVLADEESRRLYDQTGIVDGLDCLASGVTDWYAYWRDMFKPVTKKDLDEFAAKYRESAEELADLQSAYLQHEGRMDLIMDCMMCSTGEDEPRFRSTLDKLIDEGAVPRFDAYKSESDGKRKARKRKAEKEAKAAEELLREIQQKDSSAGGVENSADDLAAAIRNRGKARAAATGGSFLEQLERKYAGQEKGKRKAKAKK